MNESEGDELTTGYERLLSEFRANGRDDVLRVYAQMVEENGAAKERIYSAFAEALDELEKIRGVGAELGRLRDGLLSAQRVVSTADLTPHPSAAYQLLEAISMVGAGSNGNGEVS